MTFRLEVVPPEDWADRVADELAARIHQQPALSLCLPTGDTPTVLFTRLVARSAAGNVSFASVTIVLLDEFLGLAAGDPARCDGRLSRELLANLRPAPAAIRLIDADAADPEAAACAHDGSTGLFNELGDALADQRRVLDDDHPQRLRFHDRMMHQRQRPRALRAAGDMA